MHLAHAGIGGTRREAEQARGFRPRRRGCGATDARPRPRPAVPRARAAQAAPAGCRRTPGTGPCGRTSRRTGSGWAAVALLGGPPDGLPDRLDLALGGLQVGLVGLVAQHLPAAEVEQLQQAGRRAAATAPARRSASGTSPWPRTPRGVPCRSCSRPPAVRRRERCRADRRTPQPQPGVEVALDEQLALGRLEHGGVLQREVGVEQARADASHSARPSSSSNSVPSSGSASSSRSTRGTPGRAPGKAPGRRRAGLKSRSSTACTTVPRVAAGLGRSGSRSMTRNR